MDKHNKQDTYRGYTIDHFEEGGGYGATGHNQFTADSLDELHALIDQEHKEFMGFYNGWEIRYEQSTDKYVAKEDEYDTFSLTATSMLAMYSLIHEYTQRQRAKKEEDEAFADMERIRNSYINRGRGV